MIEDIRKAVIKEDLNRMNMDDVKPTNPGDVWTPVIIRPGDKCIMTMQGLGMKELYLIEVIRK